MLSEHGDKITEDQKAEIKTASDDLQKVLESENIDELKAASQKLLEAMSKAGQAIHQAAQAQQGQQQPGADAAAGAQQTAGDPNETVVDADYSKVKKEDENK